MKRHLLPILISTLAFSCSEATPVEAKKSAASENSQDAVDQKTGDNGGEAKKKPTPKTDSDSDSKAPPSEEMDKGESGEDDKILVPKGEDKPSIEDNRETCFQSIQLKAQTAKFAVHDYETASYSTCAISDFATLWSPELAKNKDLFEKSYDLAKIKLAEVKKLIPARRFELLKSVKFWFEVKRDAGSAVYHPGKEWLQANQINPDKAGAIELSNSSNFVAWSKDQPLMLLHELTHAFHYRIPQSAVQLIKARFEDVKKTSLYQSVSNSNGTKVKAYALNTEFEFFAELSESYYGMNDFSPFTRSELQKYDNTSLQLVDSIWNSTAY